MFKNRLLLLLLFAFAGIKANAQTQEDTYQKKITYGINFNTNGGIIGGASIRGSYTIDQKWQQFWGLEMVEVKHPKEIRVIGQSGSTFILSKTNSLFVLRPEYGREYSLFKKAPESGVEVNAVAGIGPSLGLLVPYYIVYDYTPYEETSPGSNIYQQVGPTDYRTERYDPVNNPDHRDHPELIRGNAGFLTGVGKTSVNLGLHLRTALSFEYGRYPESITGIETGFMLEAYPKKLVMIPDAPNYNVFKSVYLTIYYGRRK